MTSLKLTLWYIKTKSYTKFEPNMSKHVGEKCGKLTDGRMDGWTDGRRPGRTDITIPLYVPSKDGRIKIQR